MKNSTHCARRFQRVVRELGETDEICVKVLKGGIDGWMRSYWNDSRLVEGFDRMCWDIPTNDTNTDVHSVVSPTSV